MALGDAVADQVLSAVKSKASEFVRIVDRSSLDQILAEQGLSGSSPKGLRGVRYLVTGKLTQVLVEEPNFTTSIQSAEGRERYPCTKTNNKGQSYQDECVKDVLVKYTDHQGTSSVKLVASVKLIDVKTGEQLAAPTVTSEVADRVRYADNFKGPAGQDIVPVAYNRAGGMEVKSDDVLDLAKANRELKPVSALAGSAIQKLAVDLGASIVAQVDREVPASDPSNLVLASVE
jgi:curli biogenesis system outer membrane secretion channel CsgG